VFTLLLPSLCNGQYTWQALPGAPVSYRFDDFYFINPDTGWAINPNYSYETLPVYGRVFRTYNGGQTWAQLKDSSLSYYRSIGFADALTGWIGNLADTSIQYNDTVPMYQTNDGGVTWTPANLPNPHPAGICGISVVTDSIVFAYGRYMSPAGYVKTMDKGASWVFTSLDSLAFGLIDGHFFNKDTGFITAMGVDNKAAILYTNNGGASWRYAYHSTRIDSDRVWKIYFPTRNTGYASIEFGGSYFKDKGFNTWFLKTIDGGNTWTEKPFFANYDEEGIGFVNDSVGWLGGWGVRGTYKTTDGGNTWYDDESFGLSTPPYTNGIAGFAMNRFRSFGDTLMYASGNTIYKLKPVFTGIKDVYDVNQSISNYPNPFEDQTTIIYNLTESTKNIVLEVNNVLGQRIFYKNLGAQKKGINQIIFNEKLPAGIYFYTISNDTFNVTKKMIVSR